MEQEQAILTKTKKYAQIDQYQLIKSLGAGYNAKVKLGYNTQTGQQYAIKIFKRTHNFEKNRESLKTEYTMMKALNHQNLINLIEIKENVDYIKKNGVSYKVMAIVIEYAQKGEVFEYVAHGGMFREDIARTYFHQLIEGLEYIHSKGICHRDLKPENLLFDENFNLKIADFGFATAIAGKDSSGMLHTILGTEGYMAPEINSKQAYSGTAVDIFAAGIILFVILSGHPPFSKADPKVCPYYKVLCTNKHAAFWNAHSKSKPTKDKFYSDNLRSLFNSLFSHDPAQRPTISEIKAHPWYNGPVVDLENIKKEFEGRAQLVENEILRQKMERELARQHRQQQQQNNGGLMYTGVGVQMRSAGEVDEEFSGLDSKFQELKNQYIVQEADENNKSKYQIATALDCRYLLRLLLWNRDKFSTNISLPKEVEDADNFLKLKATNTNENDESVKFTINFFQGKDEIVYLQVKKTEGDSLKFFDILNNLKDIIAKVTGQQVRDNRSKFAEIPEDEEIWQIAQL